MLGGDTRIDCGLAGTVMRFLPAVAALADGPGACSTATRRPGCGRWGRSSTRCARSGADVDDDGAGHLPVTVRGRGRVPGGSVTMDASASSQFISALLLAGARYDEGVTVHHDGKPVPSEPHILMTVETLRDAGAIVDDSEPNTWRVEPSEINALDVSVEPDLSNAGPFVAAALVAGGTVRVPGWPQHTTQAGDLLREILDTMGADVRLDRTGLTVTGSGELVGIDIDLHDAAELTPTVAALAALASTPSWIRGRRAHPRPRDRPARGPHGRAQRTSAVRRRDRGRSAHHAGALARRAVPHLPRPPHGDGRRGARPAGARDLVEDVATTAKTLPDFVGLWQAMLDGHGRRGAAAMSWRDLDEGDIRVRPSRKGSRPRTKERPGPRRRGRGHGHRRRPRPLHLPRPKGALGKKEPERVVTAMKAREIGRTRVVVGDDVALVGDLAGGPDALARIVRIEERRSVLRRTADDTDPFERIIVANADQLVIVTALADPEPRPRMVDRCLVAAYDADLVPLLALTKADLVDPAPFLSTVHPARGRARRHRRGRDGEVVGRRGPARAPGRPGVGARRALRRRQEHARQRPRAGCGCAPPASSTTRPVGAGTRRPTPSRCACPATRATGGSSTPPASGRSAWHTSTRPHHRPLPRPRRRHRELPARLHARRGGVRPRRLGGGRPRRALARPPGAAPRSPSFRRHLLTAGAAAASG